LSRGIQGFYHLVNSRSKPPPVAGLEFLRSNPAEQFRLTQFVAELFIDRRKVD